MSVETETPARWARGLSGAVLILAVLDLVGWIFHLPLLTSVLPNYATMKPNTAICLAVLALACLLKREGAARMQGWVADAITVVPALIAVASLLEYAMYRNLGLDELVLHTGPSGIAGAEGRMSPGTAICLTLTAVALLLLDRMPRLSTGLALMTGGVALSALIGFLFNTGPLYGVPWLNSLAVHTGTCLLLLQLALLVTRPDREPVRSLSEDLGRSGRTRWLLLGVTVVPALVALPLVAGMRAGWFDPPFTLALLVVLLIAVQTLILWQDSVAIRRLETRRRLAEQALLQNEKLAVVGRLAASISHEINNPLESIGNLLYLVRDAESLEISREYALAAEQELARVAQITAQTLSFYRENREPALHAVSAILESATTLLRSKVSASGVTLGIDLRPEYGEVRCREGELRQVFINLISNALEATPNGGRVIVRLRSSRAWAGERQGGGVRVSIADTGCGMGRETVARIFEPFFTTKAETGNGLGLWVAEELVEKHGGTLRVWSSVLQGRSGTVFCVFLPFAE